MLIGIDPVLKNEEFFHSGTEDPLLLSEQRLLAFSVLPNIL